MPIGAMVVTPYYNPATGETFDQTNTAQPVPEGFIPVPEGGIPTTTEAPAQPDFMTQLNELIASMQAEQTAAAEQAAAAEKQRQEQVAAMTQNYMVGQPAVGYNPYESGQYQNNPYGPALRAIDEKEQQLQQILSNGETKDWEHYKNLTGQIEALNYVREEIRQLMKNQEIYDA